MKSSPSDEKAIVLEKKAIVLEEDYTYWTHEGYILRSPMQYDFIVEALGPGGWTQVQ